jgi:hypothetical protein
MWYKERAGHGFSFEHMCLNYTILDLPRERGHSSWLHPVKFNRDNWHFVSWSWNNYWQTSHHQLRTTRVTCWHPTFCMLSNIGLVLSIMGEHQTTYCSILLVHLETKTLGSENNCVYIQWTATLFMSVSDNRHRIRPEHVGNACHISVAVA